jgi:hypothetical protein
MRVVRLTRWAGAALALAAAAGPGRPAEPPAGAKPPEWAVKVVEILLGDPMRAGSSSLAVSKSRYGWDWLARRHGVGADAALRRGQFHGPEGLFDRIDRDGDGLLRAADFDWSDRAEFVRQQGIAQGLFNRLNGDGNGTITAPEWQALFDRLAGDRGALTTEDLQRAVFPARRASSMTRPTRLTLLRGLVSGELGSMHEGPDPGALAPDFVLHTQDGKQAVRLSQYRGHKPVVLIFGNFT